VLLEFQLFVPVKTHSELGTGIGGKAEKETEGHEGHALSEGHATDATKPNFEVL